MANILRVLILEDQPDDAELLVLELRQAGFDPHWRRVEDETGFLANLKPDLDVILSDYSLPTYNGLRALKLVQDRGVNVPFIIVTGAIGDEVAVECMKQGATDYLLKDRLARLGPAVVRALEKKRLQREKQDAEARLQASEEQYRLLFQKNLHPMWVFDRQTLEFLAVNDAAISHYGYSRREFMARTVTDLHPPQEISPLLRFLSKEGQTVLLADSVPGTWKHCKKDGTILDVELAWNPVTFEGKAGGLVLANDITKRKQFEAQLRQHQKMEAIGRLAGGVAHDFNNFLTVILGYSEMLRDRITSEDDLNQAVNEIHGAVERAAALTRQLLAFSRGQSIAPQIVDLNAAVSDMRNLLDRLIGEKIRMVSSLEPGLNQVMSDPGHVEQIIMNLAINARDAMPDGGTLTLETANVCFDKPYARHFPEIKPGDYVMLAVTDTGCGMNEETKLHLFEPFYTTKETGKGTGLGLATVYGIVQQNGGYIRVRSELGRGSRFTIYLPKAHSEVPARMTAEATMRGRRQ